MVSPGNFAYALWLPAVVVQLFITTPGVRDVREPVVAVPFEE